MFFIIFCIFNTERNRQYRVSRLVPEQKTSTLEGLGVIAFWKVFHVILLSYVLLLYLKENDVDAKKQIK